MRHVVAHLRNPAEVRHAASCQRETRAATNAAGTGAPDPTEDTMCHDDGSSRCSGPLCLAACGDDDGDTPIRPN